MGAVRDHQIRHLLVEAGVDHPDHGRHHRGEIAQGIHLLLLAHVPHLHI